MTFAPAASAPGAFYIAVTACWPCRFRLSQFGSHFAGPESQTHAFRANHSCGPRQIGQNVLLKKTHMGVCESRFHVRRYGGMGEPSVLFAIQGLSPLDDLARFRHQFKLTFGRRA